jgi:5-methylthioadenosine/S-adenosylhomocysteine deaminase
MVASRRLNMIIISRIILPNPKKPALINAGILVSRGVIVAVGQADAMSRKYPRRQIIRFPNAVLLPGLVNLHAHLELPLLLDTIRAAQLPDWVLNLIKAKKEMSIRDYAAAARANIRSLIRTGTTTVGEICTHNISPQLLKQSGLRAVIFREVISMSPGQGNQIRSRLPTGCRFSSLIKTGISPHAPYTVSEKILREIKEMSLRKYTRVCMHVGESKDEIRLFQGKKSGFDKLYQAAGWDRNWAPVADSPFEYLSRLGLLNSRFLAVHAVQATDQDIAIMKKKNISVAHCPKSNENTRVGKMPLKKLLDAGITVGLGTDSLASSPSLSMWDEMRYAYRIHRRDGVTPQDIFQIATTNGAKALGMDNLIGSLVPGKRADLIAVSLPEKESGDLYYDLLRETKSCIMTMVNGKIIYRP